MDSQNKSQKATAIVIRNFFVKGPKRCERTLLELAQHSRRDRRVVFDKMRPVHAKERPDRVYDSDFVVDLILVRAFIVKRTDSKGWKPKIMISKRDELKAHPRSPICIPHLLLGVGVVNRSEQYYLFQDEAELCTRFNVGEIAPYVTSSDIVQSSVVHHQIKYALPSNIVKHSRMRGPELVLYKPCKLPALAFFLLEKLKLLVGAMFIAVYIQ